MLACHYRQIPNDALIDHVLSASASATPSERLVLKIAASLLKQIDPEYEIREDTDERIKLRVEEWAWLPDRFEVWNAIAKPKNWEIPELIAAAEREEAEIQEIMKQAGIDYEAALTEFVRRRKKES
jgi:hypothetical protein